MQQLTQNLKDGKMQWMDVPFPASADGRVVVRNRYSVISAGTEGKTVKDARLGYVGKARARKKEMAQVLESVRTNGVAPTYRAVMRRLDVPSALGYSCAGDVISIGEGVRGLAVGDRVACGGSSAAHAEVVSVPASLCVRIPEGVDVRHAAFTTLAAIAMQGIRQADLRLGETAVVIGLGVVGLLSMQLLEAAGVQAIGIDVDPDQVALARRAGLSQAFERSDPDLEEAILGRTHGHGADAVIIAAGTSSRDPVELAGVLCRQKGRVVIVGVVPTGFSRAHYYRKELDLRMSCSYGPGRYDPRYEEHGVDYPIGYVRWTENRNMQAFVDLLAAGTVDPEPLITHTFDHVDAAEAYGMILERAQPYAGILLRYDDRRQPARRIDLPERIATAAGPSVGFIGAGSFARNILLPAVKGRAAMVGLTTARPNMARHVGERYGFSYCTDDAADIMADEQIDTVFIVTRHNLHAPFAIDALNAGKHVFVEKPLCLTLAELESVREAYAASTAHLMVGFNRRFAPHVRQMKQHFSDAVPKAVQYRINAGRMPADHWIHDPAVGGGRLVGEVCHFVDLAIYLAGSPVDRVAAEAMADPNRLQDTVSILLHFENGSTASISYFSNGSKRLPKERLEVFGGGRTAVLDDFRTLTLYGDRARKHRLRRQDKGHGEEVERFLTAVRTGGPAPIPFEDIYASMRTTLAVQEALNSGESLRVR